MVLIKRWRRGKDGKDEAETIPGYIREGQSGINNGFGAFTDTGKWKGQFGKNSLV